MNIAIIGNDVAFEEARARLGDSQHYFQSTLISKDVVSNDLDVVFDFNTEWSQPTASVFLDVSAPVFLNTVFSTLSESKVIAKGPLFGFCGLPTFFNRNRLEVVILNESQKKDLEELAKFLDFELTVVKDEVGMVTPRIVAMIINEAYEAFQQRVASREDIDLSMKLGTNYPLGPFEWADKIGLDNLNKLLDALAHSTGDTRYRSNIIP